MAYRREFRFNKRTFRNQDLGPLVNHEMNRCIQCYRCVRFYEHAGGSDLQAFASRDHVYFGRHEDGALESPFAGNLVEVCPTGARQIADLKNPADPIHEFLRTNTIHVLKPQMATGAKVYYARLDGAVR